MVHYRGETKTSDSEYTRLQSHVPHVNYFWQLLLRNGKISSKSLFWIEQLSEHSVLTEDSNKLLHKLLNNFNTIHLRINIIFQFNINQIKY